MRTDAEHFTELQQRLAPLFADLQADPAAPRTVIVVPGLSLDAELLGRVTGARHYEERQLTMLMLLRFQGLRMVYLTSTPIDPVIVDYYLSLLPGIPNQHARRRLVLLSTHDPSPVSLTQKILDRPRLLSRIRAAIGDPQRAWLTCFNATALERSLALALDVPLYATDPELASLGTKSGSRELFREAGVAFPDGRENLRAGQDVVDALAELRARDPTLEGAAVKLNEGISGEGNAVFSFDGAPAGADCHRWIADRLPRALAFEAPDMTWEEFEQKLVADSGVVEAWVKGDRQQSPSVQLRITPGGGLELISTHDQVLGGSGQRFLGSLFPAASEYRARIQQEAMQVGEVMRKRGVVGRFGIDFITFVDGAGSLQTRAIEINLRKGGTTHTFQTLQFLTDGRLDDRSGTFHVPTGPERVYYATDNLENPAYRRLTPDDLIEISIERRLLFDQTTLEGVTFNLIGALSEFGKVGVVSIAATRERALAQYERIVAVLDEETGG